MKTKTLYLFISLVIILTGILLVGVSKVNAQTASFPDGCSSALGYSVTTGNPCNGTSNRAILGPLPGCSTALGYSVTNGEPCSGGSVAIFYLGGCSSLYGYSTETGRPCNGTSIATMSAIGFPITGFGDSPLLNILLLAGLGIAASISFWYLMRFSNKS